MKKTILLVLLLASLALTFAACSEAEINHCPFAEYEHVWEGGREQEWEDDIVAIAYYLFHSPRLTPRWEEMYEHFDEELQARTIQMISDLVHSLPNLTDRDVQFRLLEVFASFGDSLTSAFTTVGDIYPILFFALHDGFYVRDVLVEYEHLLHSKLVAINGTSIEEITARFNRIISPGNVYRLRQEMMQGDMNCDDRLAFLGITNGTGVAEFTLLKPDGTVSNYTLSTVCADSFQELDRIVLDIETLLLWSRPGETYWSQDFPDYNFVYFRLHNFQPPGGRITYLRNVLRRIDNFPPEEAIDRLVIDLRRNPGFGNQITQFNMFDETDKLETIYILIDNRTGYVASIFAYMLRTAVDVENIIFVGEPTGSPEFAAYNPWRIPFNTQLTNISRSNRTEDLLMIVATGFFVPPTSDRTNVALYPDYFIPLAIEDIIAGHDPVLEFIKSRR